VGGAVATHVRVGDELFPIIFPAILGAFLWGGLYLRDERAAPTRALAKLARGATACVRRVNEN
ncbi:MAG: hypothetical protein ACRELW_18520, partial [Candidatus Rokuibacteriota bacterium]